MNRKQWEKEQSWSEFINGDMQYCRSKVTTYEEFLFLMEQLEYEIKVGSTYSGESRDYEKESQTGYHRCRVHIGIAYEIKMEESISLFVSKLESIGIVY